MFRGVSLISSVVCVLAVFAASSLTLSAAPAGATPTRASRAAAVTTTRSRAAATPVSARSTTKVASRARTARPTQTKTTAKTQTRKKTQVVSRSQASRRPLAKNRTVRATSLPVRPVPARYVPADVPPIVERASVARGCFDDMDATLAEELGMSSGALKDMIDQAGLSSDQLGDRPCVDYVATTGGSGGAASVMFLRDGADPNAGGILVMRKTDEPDALVSHDLGCVVPMRREFVLPAAEANPDASDVLRDVPAHVQWELGVLTRQMTRDLAGSDRHHLRVVIERREEPDTDRLLALELIETTTGRVVDGVWWVDRATGPGMLMGTEGVDYERLLWQSSVAYHRMSRGVGATTRTVVRRVPVRGSKTATRTVRVQRQGRQHLGVDFAAARGTDVHAVGESKVVFAGRKSGYGNIVILDHDGGYQTYYAHLSKISPGIARGVSVGRGEVIGLVGSTGRSTGPHLHFEVRKDGRYIDPFDTTHQLDLWILQPDDQARLLRQVAMLDASPSASGQFANAQCVRSTTPLALNGPFDQP